MNRLSICSIVLNEEKNLPRLLRSIAGVGDELVIVDGGSSDGTVELARAEGARVSERKFTNYAEQKNYAAGRATCEWILFLDADEELSDELRESLLKWKRKEAAHDVYEMARLTWYLGAWIHHSRWYPDWQRRLYRKDKTKFVGAVHESLDYRGTIGRLRGDLLHYTIRSFAEHEAKLERYTTASANAMFAAGKRNWRGALWLATPWSWIHHFILGAGFMDGYRGALIAQMAARGVRLKYRKLGALVEQSEKGGKG